MIILWVFWYPMIDYDCHTNSQNHRPEKHALWDRRTDNQLLLYHPSAYFRILHKGFVLRISFFFGTEKREWGIADGPEELLYSVLTSETDIF